MVKVVFREERGGVPVEGVRTADSACHAMPSNKPAITRGRPRCSDFRNFKRRENLRTGEGFRLIFIGYQSSKPSNFLAAMMFSVVVESGTVLNSRSRFNWLHA